MSEDGGDELLRHRAVPERAIGAGQVVVAHPERGTPIVLGPTASLIWHELDVWTTHEQVGAVLAATYPQVQIVEREATVRSSIVELDEQGMLERRR